MGGFSFSAIFALLTEAPQVIADLEALAAAPAVRDLEAKLAQSFTHTTTPGAAAIIEPIVTGPHGK